MFLRAIQKTAPESYDWIVISIGSAGEDKQQQNPAFLSQLAALGKKVVIYNIDPDFLPKDKIQRSVEAGVMVYRIPDAFPLHTQTQVCKNLTEDFCKLINKLLNADKQIVLLQCALPILPEAFLKLGGVRVSCMNTAQLFVIGSWCQDFLSVIYNWRYLYTQYKATCERENINPPLLEKAEAFWQRCLAPEAGAKDKQESTEEDSKAEIAQRIEKGKYYALGTDEEARHKKFEAIKAEYAALGTVVKTLSHLTLRDLDPEERLFSSTAVILEQQGGKSVVPKTAELKDAAKPPAEPSAAKKPSAGQATQNPPAEPVVKKRLI